MKNEECKMQNERLPQTKLPVLHETSRLTRHFPACESVHFFCARMRTTDVGAREMPRSVVTAEQVCKEGKFAEKIACFANLDFDVSSLTAAASVVGFAKIAGFVYRRGRRLEREASSSFLIFHFSFFVLHSSLHYAAISRRKNRTPAAMSASRFAPPSRSMASQPW